MKGKKIAYILLGIIILCLLGGNLYFIRESKKPMYKIVIGTPVDSERTNTGDIVKNKEDAHLIEFALMNAISIEKPEISKRLPDATIWLNDWNLGLSYLIIDVWFDGDKAIFAMGFDPEYKESVGTFGDDVKYIVSKYQPPK